MRDLIFLIILLFPVLLFSQEEKRTNYFVETSQGMSFMYREAFSNTNDKTFETTPGYAFEYNFGLSFNSKKGKRFSDISLGFRSYSNGLKGVVNIGENSGFSSKTSSERYNYLTLAYTYARYLNRIKNHRTFLKAGVQASYILNRRTNLKYDLGEASITTKGGNFSGNYGITTTPTFSLGYGVEIEKGIFKIGKKARLSLDVTFDKFLFGIITTPSNQYYGTLLKYQLIF